MPPPESPLIIDPDNPASSPISGSATALTIRTRYRYFLSEYQRSRSPPGRGPLVAKSQRYRHNLVEPLLNLKKYRLAAARDALIDATRGLAVIE